MATKAVRRRRLRELETTLRAAVFEVRWLTDVWNAADRVAGRPGEVPYPTLDPHGITPPFRARPAEEFAPDGEVKAEVVRLRVGVVVGWPEVDEVIRSMLLVTHHQPVEVGVGDCTPPDVVVRDVGCVLIGGWSECPVVVVSGAGLLGANTGVVTLAKPFSSTQLDEAIRRAARAKVMNR